MKINTLVAQFKQEIVKTVNESQLPPVIVSTCLGEIKGIVDRQTERAIREETEEKESKTNNVTAFKNWFLYQGIVMNDEATRYGHLVVAIKFK